MPYYRFEAGGEVIEVIGKPIKDFRIRANNDIFQTGKKFVSMAALLDKKKFDPKSAFKDKPMDWTRFFQLAKERREHIKTMGDLLRWKLAQIYDDYVKREFMQMGYRLTIKRVEIDGS